MANLCRVRVGWTGTPLVGAGLSTFYFDEAHSGFNADVRAFFDSFKLQVPTGVTWSFPSSGDIIDDTDGSIVGSWSDPTGGALTSTGSGSFALGVGVSVTWRTSGLTGNRRVLGRTFLAPILSAQFEGANAIVEAFRSSLQVAANTLVTDSAGAMRIWTQPTATTIGKSSPVTSADVKDAVSWLRSRRT